MDPMSLLLGGGMSLAGGAADAFGFRLGDAFDMGGGSKTTSQMQDAAQAGMDAGVNTTLNNAQALTQQSMYNAAGQTGPGVRSGFLRAMDNMGNTVGARRSANELQRSGRDMLSGANSQAVLANKLAQQNLGTMRKDSMNILKGAGGNPAAMGSALGKLGGGASQGATQMLAASNAGLMDARRGAAGMTAQAQNILGQDLGQQYQMKVDPYKAQINQGITSMAGNLGSVGARLGTQSVTEGRKERTNPLSGLAGFLTGEAGVQSGLGAMRTMMGMFGDKDASGGSVGSQPYGPVHPGITAWNNQHA